MSAPSRPGRVMFARQSLERLATDCLSAAMTAGFIASGNNPEKVDYALVGKIAAMVAVAIREEVGRHVEAVMMREDADAYIERLAMTIAEGEKGGAG